MGMGETERPRHWRLEASAVNCPGDCGHPTTEHGKEGCEHDWEWSAHGLVEAEGCDCMWSVIRL